MSEQLHNTVIVQLSCDTWSR